MLRHSREIIACNDEIYMYAVSEEILVLCCEDKRATMAALFRVLILGAIFATADIQQSEKGIVLKRYV